MSFEDIKEEEEEDETLGKILNEYYMSPNVQVGMHWLAATIAHKNRHLDQDLGNDINDENQDISTQEFNKFVNEGLLIYPSFEFHTDVMEMHALFSSIHPHNSLTKGPGVVQNCFSLLKKHFPEYHHEILHFTARLFVFSRLRLMNELSLQKKNSKGAQTSRGRVQIARRST